MKDVFPIIPAGGGPLWVLLVIGGLMLAVVAFFAFIAYGSRHSAVEVSDAGLRIQALFYGREIPFSSLLIEAARPLDLAREKEYAPVLRTNGIGLPGYRAGWFKLRNGHKALAFVTDQRRVALIPTRDGYLVMVSVPDPAAFLDTLRRRAP
jgi:hypothetical protein